MNVTYVKVSPRSVFPVLSSERNHTRDLDSVYGVNIAIGRLAVELLQGFRDYLIFQPSEKSAPRAHSHFPIIYNQCSEAEATIYQQQVQSCGASLKNAVDYLNAMDPILAYLRRAKLTWDEGMEVFTEPPAFLPQKRYDELIAALNDCVEINFSTHPDSELSARVACNIVVSSILELIKLQFEERVKFYTIKLTEEHLREDVRAFLSKSIRWCQSLLTETDNLIQERLDSLFKERRREKSIDSKEKKGVLLGQLFDVDVIQSSSQSSAPSLEAKCGVEESVEQQISQEIGFIDLFEASSPFVQKKILLLIIFRSMAKTKLLSALMDRNAPKSSLEVDDLRTSLKNMEPSISNFKDKINSEDPSDFYNLIDSLSFLFYEESVTRYQFDGYNHCIAYHLDRLKLINITPFSVPCTTAPCPNFYFSSLLNAIHNANFNKQDESVPLAERKYISIEASFPEAEIMKQLREVAGQYVIQERDWLNLFDSTMPPEFTQSAVFMFERAVNAKLLQSALLVAECNALNESLQMGLWSAIDTSSLPRARI